MRLKVKPIDADRGHRRRRGRCSTSSSQQPGPGAVRQRENITTFLVVGVSLGGIYAISAAASSSPTRRPASSTSPTAPSAASSPSSTGSCAVNRGWPAPLALVVGDLRASRRCSGIVLDKLLMRRLRNATLVVQLMVTVGLMLAFMGITLTDLEADHGPHAARTSSRAPSGVELGDVTATWHRIITVVVALVHRRSRCAALLYRTRTRHRDAGRRRQPQRSPASPAPSRRSSAAPRGRSAA